MFASNFMRATFLRYESAAALKTGTGLATGTTYTQTYSTAAVTNPAVTSNAITDSSGGTPSTSAIASITTGGGTYPDATPTKNAIATLAAELALTKADLLAVKKLANQLIDDLQAAGIVL